MPGYSGQTANVTVAAPVGGVYNVQIFPVQAGVASKFKGYQSVTATSATMEFGAGQPVQIGLTTLARDRWFQMYPG